MSICAVVSPLFTICWCCFYAECVPRLFTLRNHIRNTDFLAVPMTELVTTTSVQISSCYMPPCRIARVGCHCVVAACEADVWRVELNCNPVARARFVLPSCRNTLSETSEPKPLIPHWSGWTAVQTDHLYCTLGIIETLACNQNTAVLCVPSLGTAGTRCASRTVPDRILTTFASV